MSKSIEEWQEELDAMFPNGAHVFRGQTPEGARQAESHFITEKITVIDVVDDAPVIEVYPEGSWFESLVLETKSIGNSVGGYLIMTSSLNNPATVWLPREEMSAA